MGVCLFCMNTLPLVATNITATSHEKCSVIECLVWSLVDDVKWNFRWSHTVVYGAGSFITLGYIRFNSLFRTT